MKASNLLFWKRTSKKQLEIIDRLTKALVELNLGRQQSTDVITQLMSSPERLGEFFRRALQMAQGPQGAAVYTATQLTGGTPIAMLPSGEAVQEQVDIVTKAVLAKMDQMEKHIAEAVSQLSPEALRRIAEKLEAGEDFSLRRRHGCIHLDFGTGDDEYYLRL